MYKHTKRRTLDKTINMKKRYFFAISLYAFCCSAIFAQEGTWARQNPFASLVQMNDVAVDAAGAGLAVGDDGVLLRSSDFGAHWTEIPNDFPALLKVGLVPGSSSQEAWIGMSSSSGLARTIDGGATWQPSSGNSGLSNVNLLALPSSNVVYAGNTLQLFKSTDQGQTWDNVTPVAGENWQSLSFVDENTGWASANSGAIYRTTDGGATWTAPSPGQFDARSQLLFLDANQGYAAVGKNFYATEDGGQTWSLRAEDAFSTTISALDGTDSGFLVVVLGNTSFASANEGVDWERVLPLAHTYINRGVCVLPEGKAWIAGSHTMIAHSSDFGQSYIDQVPGVKANLNSLSVVDDEHVWAAGAGGSVLRTADGGSTWSDVSAGGTGVSSTINAGLAFSADEFWACQGPNILRTTDAGQSWAPIEDDVLSGSGTLTAMQEVAGQLFVTGYSGKVYRTADQGATWEALPTGNALRLFGLHFPEATTGYAVGEAGSVLKTTDGGDNWTALSFPETGNLNKVFFLNAEEGWITFSSNRSEIAYTDDGGATWSITALPISGFWNSFAFIGPTKGFLAGGSAGNGRVLRTIDGGATWAQVHATYSILWSIAHHANEVGDRLWVAGAGGNIERWESTAVNTVETVEPGHLKVYPNPARQQLQVELPDGQPSSSTLSLYDSMGRLRLSQAYQPQLSLAGLAPGWYMLRLANGAQVCQTRVLLLPE